MPSFPPRIAALAPILIASLWPAVSFALGFEAPFHGYDVPGRARQLAVGDLNGDTHPDVVTGNDDGTVSILFGNGTGGLGARTDYPSTGRPLTAVALGRLDSDGDLDLVWTDDWTSTWVRLNNGDGSFGPATEFNVHSRFLALADMNGDTKLDLVNQAGVWLGNGNGGFASSISFPIGTPNYSIGCAIGTLDANATPDLVLVDPAGGSVLVLLGNGDGSFGTPTAYPVSAIPVAVAIGNLNGTGGLDLVVSRDTGAPALVFPGNGDGTFGSATSFGTLESVHAMALGDFDGDGNVDVAAAGQRSAPDGASPPMDCISILPGDGSGSFGPQRDLVTRSSTVSLVAMDLNADTAPELVSAGNGPVCVAIGNGDGTFGWLSHYTVGTRPGAVAAGDVNHDGATDLAVATLLGTSVVTLRGAGNGTFGAPDPVGFLGANSVAMGLLNADANLDYVVTHPGAGSTSSVSVHLGNGDGTFGAATSFEGGASPAFVAIAGVDGQPELDLVVSSFHADSGAIAVLPGNGDGTFGPTSYFPLGSDPAGFALADLDGDGDLDVAAARAAPLEAQPVSILLGNGDGTLGAPAAYGSGGGATSVAVGKLDPGDALDLVVGGGAGFRVLLGNGDGTFGSETSYATDLGFGSIVLGDVDLDGKLDVAGVATFGFPARRRNAVCVLRGNGDGTFGARVEYGAGWGPVALAMANLDADDRLDLVTADNTGETVTALLNRTAAKTAVLLLRFEAAWRGDAIEVRWQFGPGAEALNETLERSASERGPWTIVNGLREEEAGALFLRDVDVARGRLYFYRLVARRPEGGTMTLGPVSTAGEPAAQRFDLARIAPNPADHAVRIEFVMPTSAPVRLRVLDLGGRLVTTLAEGTLPAGRHEALWEPSEGGGRVAPGVYFVRLEWSGGAASRRIALTR